MNSLSADQQPWKDIPGLSRTEVFRFVIWHIAAFSGIGLAIILFTKGMAFLFLWPVWILAVTLGLSCFLLLSVPRRAWIGPDYLVVKCASRSLRIPRSDVERARRMMMDSGLFERSPILLVIPTRAISTRVCLIMLNGTVRPGGDPFSVRDRVTALDMETNDDGSPWLPTCRSNKNARSSDGHPR